MTALIRRSLLALTLLSAATAFSTVSHAEKNKDDNKNLRAVQGIVTDATNNPIDHAIVQIKDTKSLQVRSYITQQDGAYHFNGLSPSIDYELRAEFQAGSSDKKTLSTFDSRKTAVLNLVVKEKK